MPRDSFINTIGRQSGVTFEPLSNVEITVFIAGTSTLATIYQARTGGAQGPTPRAVASGVNPFTTGASGLAEFFCEPGEYRVHIHDTNASPRIGDQDLYWNSVPMTPGAGMPISSLADEIKRQMLPIGAKIDWWRPSASDPVPAGFEIADGRTIVAANHGFATAGDIVLPDCRKKFSLGADIAITDGTAAGAGDAGAAPGIRGAGGSHERNLSHSHIVNAHSHTVNNHNHSISSDGAHSHTVNTHDHNGVTSANGGQTTTTQGTQLVATQIGGGTQSVGNHTHQVVDHTHTIAASAPGTSSQASHSHGGSTGNQNPATDSQSPGTNAQLSSPQDIKPQYVGFLVLIKVRWA